MHRPPRCRARHDSEIVLWQGAGVREREINGKEVDGKAVTNQVFNIKGERITGVHNRGLGRRV